MSACTVCRHPECARIEALHAAGASFEVLAGRFGLSKQAIHRHWTNHVSVERRGLLLSAAAPLAQLRDVAMDVLARATQAQGNVLAMALGQGSTSVVPPDAIKRDLMEIGRAHPTALPDVLALIARIDRVPRRTAGAEAA